MKIIVYSKLINIEKNIIKNLNISYLLLLTHTNKIVENNIESEYLKFF